MHTAVAGAQDGILLMLLHDYNASTKFRGFNMEYEEGTPREWAMRTRDHNNRLVQIFDGYDYESKRRWFLNRS